MPMIGNLERAMDALSVRERVLTHNLANLNTPGYKRADVDFFHHMREQYADRPASPTPQIDTLTAARSDGNNVTLEREVFALTQTDLLHQAAVQSAQTEFAMLSYAITEGRG